MACTINFKGIFVQLNNTQFARLIDFGIEMAERLQKVDDRLFVERMKKMNSEVFFTGRGIFVLEDFPSLDEQKFWSCIFFEVSRAIFDRKIGVHEHSCWQAQAIHQSHATGLLFERAVRDVEPEWSANTLDRREFYEFTNRIERSQE